MSPAKMETRPTGLIIDDDPEFVASVKFHVEKLGLKLVCTHSLAELATELRRLTPDFFLIDMNLGEVRAGFALISSLRAKLGWEVPLIVLSGESSMDAITRAIELGATDYLIKPVNRDLLAAKLGGFVASPELSEVDLPLVAVGRDQAKVTIAMDCELRSVDELGITLACQGMYSRGTRLKLSSPALSQITGRSSPQPVTVVDTTLRPDRTYLAYCEFEDLTDSELAVLRKWLVSQVNKAAARAKDKS